MALIIASMAIIIASVAIIIALIMAIMALILASLSDVAAMIAEALIDQYSGNVVYSIVVFMYDKKATWKKRLSCSRQRGHHAKIHSFLQR